MEKFYVISAVLIVGLVAIGGFFLSPTGQSVYMQQPTIGPEDWRQWGAPMPTLPSEPVRITIEDEDEKRCIQQCQEQAASRKAECEQQYQSCMFYCTSTPMTDEERSMCKALCTSQAGACQAGVEIMLNYCIEKCKKQ